MTLTETIIGFGISLITGLVFSTVTYYMFLRKIPEITEKKISDLIDIRLNVDSSNHNTISEYLNPKNSELSFRHKEISAALNPTNEHLSGEHKDLSGEHKEILDKTNNIDKAFAIQNEKQKANYSLLSISQKTIVDSVSNLKNFSVILEDMNFKYEKLLIENKELKSKLEEKQTKESIENNKSRTKVKYYDRDR